MSLLWWPKWWYKGVIEPERYGCPHMHENPFKRTSLQDAQQALNTLLEGGSVSIKLW